MYDDYDLNPGYNNYNPNHNYMPISNGINKNSGKNFLYMPNMSNGFNNYNNSNMNHMLYNNFNNFNPMYQQPNYDYVNHNFKTNSNSKDKYTSQV